MNDTAKQGVSVRETRNTLPVPATPLADIFGRVLEVGNDRRGRVAKFLEHFESKHPYIKDAQKPDTITLTTADTSDGTEYCFRIAPHKKGEKVFSIKTRLKGVKTLDGECTPASKLLQLLLARTLQMGYSLRKNNFINAEILITPTELVALGIYDSVGSVLTHLDDALAKIASILLKVAARADGGQTTLFIPLIQGWRHDGKHWVIKIEKDLPYWAQLLPMYTRFPIRGFRLGGKAFTVLRYLMILTNLNKARLANAGNFVISVDSLVERLFLNRNDKHKRDALVIPVQRVIEEINQSDCGVQLRAKTAGDSTQDFLDGKIQVHITPELFAEFQTKKQVKNASKGGEK